MKKNLIKKLLLLIVSLSQLSFNSNIFCMEEDNSKHEQCNSACIQRAMILSMPSRDDEEMVSYISYNIHKNHDLMFLYFSNKQITDVGMNFLAELIKTGKLQKLKVLDFENTQITDVGLARLLEVIRALPDLKQLKLSHTKITDAGVASLLDAIRGAALPNLELLKLNNNQITDASVVNFVDLIKAGFLFHLNTIELIDTQITQAGRTALLHCEVRLRIL